MADRSSTATDAPGRPAASVPIRVFILDDHDLVRRGLRELLEGEGFEIVGSVRCV